MSRFRPKEISSPLSLFPFIGVLLSTMGALLVVLIAVSRSARDSALRDVEAKQEAFAAAQASLTDEERQELLELSKLSMQLEHVRIEGESKLRDEQLRLSHVEEQLRILEDQLASLRIADAELKALDEDHVDDRRQAERELGRLQGLIADSRQQIAALKNENSAKKKSYAIIPYEGPNGTHRRPLYIECREDYVILQPEGIKLTAIDFAPPLDAGNPLAAALRAAREHLTPTTDGSAPTKQMEPYPLLLIRPDGIHSYYVVRRAIETSDEDFGYEFVGGDWKLEFPAADAQLAKLEFQAIDQARRQREAMAIAAPRAFAAMRSVDGGVSGSGGDGFVPALRRGSRFGGERTTTGRGRREETESASGMPQETYARLDFSDLGFSSGSGDRSNSLPSADRDKSQTAVPTASSSQTGRVGGAPSADSAGKQLVKSAAGNANQTGTADGAVSSEAEKSSTSVSAADGVPGGPAPAGATSNAASPPPAGVTSGSSDDRSLGNSPGASLPSLPASKVHDAPAAITAQEIAKTRGPNWAVSRGGGNIPVRRSIRVVVRKDRISILPDDVAATEVTGGKEIEVATQSIENIDEIVAMIQQHVQEWGIAGQGLYWRPVLVVHVGPEAEPRVAELTKLLKNSGIELRVNTAQLQDSSKGPGPRASR